MHWILAESQGFVLWYGRLCGFVIVDVGWIALSVWFFLSDHVFICMVWEKQRFLVFLEFFHRHWSNVFVGTFWFSSSFGNRHWSNVCLSKLFCFPQIWHRHVTLWTCVANKWNLADKFWFSLFHCLHESFFKKSIEKPYKSNISWNLRAFNPNKRAQCTGLVGPLKSRGVYSGSLTLFHGGVVSCPLVRHDTQRRLGPRQPQVIPFARIFVSGLFPIGWRCPRRRADRPLNNRSVRGAWLMARSSSPLCSGDSRTEAGKRKGRTSPPATSHSSTRALPGSPRSAFRSYRIVDGRRPSHLFAQARHHRPRAHPFTRVAFDLCLPSPRCTTKVGRNRNSLLHTRVQRVVSGFRVSAFATPGPTEHRHRLDLGCNMHVCFDPSTILLLWSVSCWLAKPGAKVTWLIKCITCSPKRMPRRISKQRTGTCTLHIAYANAVPIA